MKNLIYILVLPALFFSTGCCELLDICPDPDPTTHEVGETIWMHDMPGSDSLDFGRGLIALGTDGSIYYSAGRNYDISARIFAVDKEDGSLKWKSETLECTEAGNIVVGDDGTIYTVCGYTLYAINPITGAFEWTWECPHTLFWDGADRNTFGGLGNPVLTNNGDLILGTTGTGAYYRSLFCVDKTTGNLKWYNLDANNGLNSELTIGKDGVLFYYSWLWTELGEKPHLVSIEPSSGAIKWKKEIISSGGGSNNVVIADDGSLICVFSELGAASNEHHMHRIDPATGNVVRSSPFGLHHRANFIGPDGHIYQYAWDTDGQGYFRIDPQLEGKELCGTKGRIFAINDQNKILYGWASSTAANPSLVVANLDGSIDWSIPMEVTGDVFLISDSKVIYGITYGQIFAIQGDAMLASSGWPKPAHDNRNTNNWSKR